MRIKYIELAGATYPACCGLYALADIQKKYGDFNTFAEKLLGKDGVAPDMDTIIYGVKLFTDAGAKATGEGSTGATDDVLAAVSNPYKVAADIGEIYYESMVPDSPEAESQTKEMENQ